jgi:hypothetical protein
MSKPMTNPTKHLHSGAELVVPTGIGSLNSRMGRGTAQTPIEPGMADVLGHLDQGKGANAANSNRPTRASTLLETRLDVVDPADQLLHARAEIFDFHGGRPWTFGVSTDSVGTSGPRSRAIGVLHPAPSRTRRPFATAAAFGLAGVIALQALPAEGQTIAPNVFADALINGSATAPIPPRPGQFSTILARLQATSGSSEPVSIIAARVTKFIQQPHCGRVQFVFGQPRANVIFKSFAGQMNVCEDGQPPLRVCPDRPSVLVPASASCPNGRPPVDTDEVATAIRDAGGMTQEQMMRSWAHQVATHARAASSAGVRPASGVLPGNLKGAK